ncbi:TPA: MarR family winged helix-turn-helix transcriptional regulator [Vibrio cholerae]|uniref:MarR family winged helix-turn-helix transcriptional regulator n=1 Tax=Vibrio TaxID=662 RepID=UPI00053C37B5|nr:MULTISPECIES: MarR family transcriptional regulator [Vibrio]EGR4139021.1 MarR family transcriptional regulator [Vibrio cholerae]EGR4163966.1 MarR family transcriptional regulator [Vibrio cholerae]EGR4173119.1 MarR family transcriptional regulator [Vibrio cholerae]EIO5086726.1 MarR family transcriptional regulator [Vibrio cholerae]EJK2098472.1 MarR family transcriptional regulator [Vibrio cholerae]
MPNDKVDAILAQWRSVRPDLDCSSMGVVGRLRQTNGIWKTKLDQVFDGFGLSCIEFDILATIRRNDREITPTELYQTLMLSSGAISTRIEQLVQRGLVQRVASEQDRRSCKVTLTEQGIELVDQALNAHVANVDGMLSVLTEQERKQLGQLLKKILLAE